MKKIFHSFLVLVIATALVLTAFPTEVVSAKPKHEDKDNWWDWSGFFDDWEETDEKPTDYLVLVGEANGSYTAYDDIAFLTGGNYVMVQAKPLATALGLKYQMTSGNKRKKGMSLSLGQDKNVYFRNSRTFYFYDYNSETKQTNATGYSADYKQIVHENENAVAAATLRTLVNY